jgi:hypothetical protein
VTPEYLRQVWADPVPECRNDKPRVLITNKRPPTAASLNRFPIPRNGILITDIGFRSFVGEFNPLLVTALVHPAVSPQLFSVHLSRSDDRSTVEPAVEPFPHCDVPLEMFFACSSKFSSIVFFGCLFACLPVQHPKLFFLSDKRSGKPQVQVSFKEPQLR